MFTVRPYERRNETADAHAFGTCKCTDGGLFNNCEFVFGFTAYQLTKLAAPHPLPSHSIPPPPTPYRRDLFKVLYFIGAETLPPPRFPRFSSFCLFLSLESAKM